MEKILFKVSSITNAQRGQKVLTSHGIPALIKKIQNPQNGDGCGYMIVVSSGASKAEKILIENGIRIVGVEKG